MASIVALVVEVEVTFVVRIVVEPVVIELREDGMAGEGVPEADN